MGSSDNPRFDSTLGPGSSPVAAQVIVDRVREGELPIVSPANYELGREIATGGMGRIVAARDRRLDRPVAIKQLLVHSEPLRQRFEREVRISARLQHPAIVSVLEAGQWPSGEPFYAMKLVVGRSLGQAIGERGSLAERMALLPHVIAAADALAYAHGQKIIHRDLKPANVLVGDFGETVVIDWGLAKDMSAQEPDVPVGPYRAAASGVQTISGAIIGTPAYMPPEQARGEPVDARADVYALGALLYHVLAGEPPFRGASSKEVLAAVLSQRPEPLEQRQPDVPADLLALVGKAMAADPAARYPSAAELAADLKRFQTGKLVSAYAYTGGELVRRWLRRHRAISVLGAAALVTIAVIGGLSFRRVRAERRLAEQAAAQASARANALVLTQAESALDTDPTRTIAWLKTYPPSGDDWARVRALADDARSRGVARRVLRHNVRNANEAGVREHGRSLLSFEAVSELRRWDVESGRSSARCLPVPRKIGGDTASLSGAWVLYGARDGTLSAWQPESDERELLTVEPDLQDAEISADGRWVVVTTARGEVRVIDRQTGEDRWFAWLDDAGQLRLLRQGARLLLKTEWRVELWDVARAERLFVSPPTTGRPAVSADERYVVWRVTGGVVWLDMDRLELAFVEAELGLIAPISFFPDGRVLVGDRRRGAVIWDPRRGDTRVLRGLGAGATAVSAGGRRVASGGGDGKLRVLDLDSGDLEVFSSDTMVEIDQVSFMPGDQELLTTSADGTLRLWPIHASGALVWRLDPGGAGKPFFALRDDGGLVVASAPDGTLWRRPLPSGTPMLVGQNPSPVRQLAFLHDGEHVLVADAANELSRWTLADGKRELIARDLPALNDLVVTRDGRRAIGSSMHRSETWVWDLETGEGTIISSGQGSFVRVFLSPDERWVGLDSAVDDLHVGGVHELATGRTIALADGPVDHVVKGFSPSSRFVFAGTMDGTLSRFDLERGTRVELSLHAGAVDTGLALSDGVFIESSEQRLYAWLPALGVGAPLDQLPTPAQRLELSPSGARVLLQDASVAYAWDVASGARHTLRGHDAGPLTVRWAGEDRLVSSSGDGTVRVWTLPEVAARTPRETRAWLESLTNFEIGDMDRREPSCR